MFDCPEPTHTSPTSTSLIVTVLAPLTTISCGPPAFSGSRVTFHLPPLSAAAVCFWPQMATVTFSSAAAVPQTGTRISRWITM